MRRPRVRETPTMTSAAQTTTSGTDWRTVVRAGVNVGIVTVVGVVVFAMLSPLFIPFIAVVTTIILTVVGLFLPWYYLFDDEPWKKRD